MHLDRLHSGMTGGRRSLSVVTTHAVFCRLDRGTLETLELPLWQGCNVRVTGVHVTLLGHRRYQKAISQPNSPFLVDSLLPSLLDQPRSLLLGCV